MTWQQQHPDQGAPPPAGFHIPPSGTAGFPYPQQPGFQPQGFPQQPGYPQQSGFPQQPGFPAQGYPPNLYNQSFGAAQPQFQMPSGGYENADYPSTDFTDKNIRRGFIRKVYGILMCQLLVTLAMVSLFLYHEPTRRFVQMNPYLYWVGFIMLFVVMIVLACCGEVRRKSPINLILLGVFTIIEGFVLGCVTSQFNASEIWLGIGITAAVCLALTLFAFQTKWDFTAMGGILLVCFVILFLFGIIAIFVKVKIVSLIYSCLGALLFSIYLVYDTQLMMGGNHKYSISPEEYIFAALNLYIDIINIFMMIMGILGNSRD